MFLFFECDCSFTSLKDGDQAGERLSATLDFSRRLVLVDLDFLFIFVDFFPEDAVDQTAESDDDESDAGDASHVVEDLVQVGEPLLVDGLLRSRKQSEVG